MSGTGHTCLTLSLATFQKERALYVLSASSKQQKQTNIFVHNKYVESWGCRLNMLVQSTKVTMPETVNVPWCYCRQAMGGKGSESQQRHISAVLCRMAWNWSKQWLFCWTLIVLSGFFFPASLSFCLNLTNSKPDSSTLLLLLFTLSTAGSDS